MNSFGQTSCVTILNTSSTFTPVRADVSTKNNPFCSANAFASSRLTSRRAPLLTKRLQKKKKNDSR